MFSPSVPSIRSPSCGTSPTWGPSSALSQMLTSTPSSRTLPASGGHSPIRMRASVVLPQADEPSTPSTPPGVSWNDRPLMNGAAPALAPATRFSTATRACGRGKGMFGVGARPRSSIHSSHPPAQPRPDYHHPRPAGQLVAQQQPGAQAQQRRSQRGLEKLANGLKDRRPVRGPGPEPQGLGVPPEPAPGAV